MIPIIISIIPTLLSPRPVKQPVGCCTVSTANTLGLAQQIYKYRPSKYTSIGPESHFRPVSSRLMLLGGTAALSPPVWASDDDDDGELNVLGCRVDILGTNCDQCVCMVQCCFTPTESIRLIRTESPGRPPPFSHSSWTLMSQGSLGWDIYSNRRLDTWWSYPEGLNKHSVLCRQSRLRRSHSGSCKVQF